MAVNRELMLFNLANTFDKLLSIEISENTKSYLKSKIKKKNLELSANEKLYYVTYSLKLAKCLNEYLNDIILFDIYDNDDESCQINHDFKITYGKEDIAYLSLSHKSINVKDIIPKKLMKSCGYSGHTSVAKQYNLEYRIFNKKTYKRLKSKEKFSNISKKNIVKYVYNPVCNMVVDSLSKKRKCSQKLFNFLFSESERIVFRLHKNKFIMYDFDTKMEDATSYRMKLYKNNIITIKFNNGAIFNLKIRTNASKINEQLSLKFKVTFANIDELYSKDKKSISA